MASSIDFPSWVHCAIILHMIPCEYICTPMRAGAGEPATETITSPRGGKLYNVPLGGSA